MALTPGFKDWLKEEKKCHWRIPGILFFLFVPVLGDMYLLLLLCSRKSRVVPEIGGNKPLFFIQVVIVKYIFFLLIVIIIGALILSFME